MIPLHLPSHWSLARGVASPAEIVARASSWELPSLALTDLENLCGAVEFHHRCLAAGIRPILGVELRPGFVAAGRERRTGSRRGRIVLLARDSTGYRSLCRIVSRRRTGSPREPLGDPVPDVLAEPRGLFALADDPFTVERLLGSGFPRRYLRLLWIRPRYRMVEEERIVQAGDRLRVPLVADLDPVFLDDGDASLLQLRLATGRRVPLHGTTAPPYRRLLPPASATALFADRPRAVRECARIAAACDADVLPLGARFPDPVLSPGETAAGRLAGIARAALNRARAEGRMGAGSYDARLERELSVVETTGLVPWFLGIAEILDFARSRRIEGMARGSAVGSLLCHLLGLSPVDPVENGLLFERFLRVGRVSPPDIDLDLPSRRRGEVVDWVLRRWEGHAAPVGAHACFGPRSARAETALALGLPKDDPAFTLPRDAERLIGTPRSFSVHPGGIVFTAEPVRDRVPLEMAPKGVAATQFDGRALDGLGIVKLDLLGNHCLDELDRAIELLSRPPTGCRREPLRIRELPLDDRPTLERLSAGDTLGCSQIETPAVRGVLRRRPIRSVEDLTRALATVRPGPTEAAGSGGPLYEEDLMRLLASAGGISLEEADAWRSRIVASDEVAATLEDLGRTFVQASGERGKPSAEAERAWSRAVPFARYAFSRAHASSQALLAYWAAYMRTRFPTEYGSAVVDEHGGAYRRRTIVAEVSRWGISIRPPSVNRSECRSIVSANRELRLGLNHVRGLTDRSKDAILCAREREGPAGDLSDLLGRVRLRLPEVEALVLSGACDELHPTSADGYPFVHEAVVAVLRSGATPASICGALLMEGRPDRISHGKLERYRALVRARNELRYLGSFPTRHPLAILRDEAARAGCRTVAEVVGAGSRGHAVRIAALPAVTRGVGTSRGPMRFVTWEDETGLLEGTIAPADHPRLIPRLDTGRAYVVSGRLRSGPDPLLEVEALIPFEQRGRLGPRSPLATAFR